MKVKELEEKVSVLVKENEKLKRAKLRLSEMMSQEDNVLVLKDNFVEHVETAIDSVVDRSFLTNTAEISKEIAKAVFNMSNQNVRSNLVLLSKNVIRKDVYPSWKVVKAMDVAGSTVNMSGIEILQKIETGEKNSIRVQFCLVLQI